MDSNKKPESLHYDYIILGSGFIESTLACILASKKKKIIILDSNDVYGSDLATLQYSQLDDFFGKNDKVEELLNLDKDFCIDITPKLLLADSGVVKLLIKYKVDESLEFINIPGSFIYKNKLHSVPCTEAQSLKTGLVGFWEKYHVMKFFWDVKAYGQGKEYSFKRTMKEEFDKYGLSSDVREFIGHAIALNLNDSYLDRDPKETFDKICLYVKSLLCFFKSPYIYPKYGISGIIQGFIRNACINNAEVMLRAEIKEIDTCKNVIRVIEPVGKKEMVFSADKIISDQSYIQRHCKSREVIRGICIIKGDNNFTNRATSSQILFLKSEYGRSNDIFVVILSKEEEATPEGYKVAIISTVKETEDPEKEIEPVITKLGNIVKKFIEVRNVYQTDDLENIYFTKGVDESTHFETLYAELLEMCCKLEIKIEDDKHDQTK